MYTDEEGKQINRKERNSKNKNEEEKFRVQEVNLRNACLVDEKDNDFIFTNDLKYVNNMCKKAE